MRWHGQRKLGKYNAPISEADIWNLKQSQRLSLIHISKAFVDFPTREISSIGERDTVTYTAILEKGTGDRDIQVGAVSYTHLITGGDG